MNELRNIDVHIISIVDKGANKKNIIWKSNDTGQDKSPHDLVHTFEIKKTDDEKKIVYGVVYSPNEEDAHGDFATAETIEKACYNFMKKSKTSSVDKQHDLDTDQNLFVGENWIVKSNDALFPDEVGAWAVGIKVENDEIWKSVKSGEFTGISMYGYAEKTEVSDDNIEKGIMKFFKKLINGETMLDKVQKDFNERVAMMDYPKLIDALYSSFYDVLYDENTTDKTAGILECVDQFKAHIANIETMKSIAKAGKVVSDSNMKKLQAAMESLQTILDAAEKSTEKRDLQKTESDKIKNLKVKGEIDMTAEEIKKQIDDALKPVIEDNTALKTENADLKKRLEDVEKTSAGSKQKDITDEPVKEEVKKVFPWASGPAKE